MDEKHRYFFRILFGLAFFVMCHSTGAAAEDYTVLNQKHYRQIVQASREKISILLRELKPYRQAAMDAEVAFIAKQLADSPYLYDHAMGEGDWQSSSATYQPGAIHLNQNPVYRLDGFNCQTLVQVVVALLHATTLDEFDQQYVQVAYGTAHLSPDHRVHFINRNHFVDADFNPVNEKNGWLQDITGKGELAAQAKETAALIKRDEWILKQETTLAKTVQVLSATNGEAMVRHFLSLNDYLKNKKNSDKFLAEKIKIAYFPKTSIALRDGNNGYYPNHILLDKIKTPAVAEIVYDHHQWYIGKDHITKLIGTELNIAHLGLLYRQVFQYGELIYHKITCHAGSDRQKICKVTPIVCEKKFCRELMFVHATDAYPKGYKWYKNANGQYVCTRNYPSSHVNVTDCNRVVRQPLFSYLTDYQFGAYWYMNWPAILGVHIEQLLPDQRLTYG